MTREEGTAGFNLLEATIADLQAAFLNGTLTARRLVEGYLKRIEELDASGPKINSIITVNPTALADADAFDRALEVSGLTGSLHGVPVILKDQIDAEGMPTTLGSVLFKDYRPKRDAFVVEKLKATGAIILAKATLGELGQGDTHGSLFGSTRNPYDLERTVGGSSGGPAAAVAANFGSVAIGQEALTSIRRPAAWNSVVGMRPTAGLVSRSGVYGGWPSTAGSLGPLTRTVGDLARLLEVIVGYDSDDPLTALGIGHSLAGLAGSLEKDALQSARIGILREPMGLGSEPDSDDFRKVSRTFEKAVAEVAGCGAEVIDPVVIPNLQELLACRSGGGASAGRDDGWTTYFSRGSNPPFRTREEMIESPDYARVHRGPSLPAPPSRVMDYRQAREELMVSFLKIMADLNLDAIVYKSVEHQPTLIVEGIGPPYVNAKGATHLNTFLVYVPAISVPGGFTEDGLPIGITFMGRPFSDALMVRLAYGFEQATLHRRPPELQGN